MERIGIVTVDFNGHKDTLDLIASSGRLNTDGFEVKWFLVDNGSDEYLGDVIHQDFKDYEILQTGENKGFAGGYNFGIRYAIAWGADYVFAINNDTLIADGEILQKLVKTLKKEPKNAIVSPKILFAKGFEYQKDRYKPDERGHVIWYGGGYIDWNNVFGKNRGIDDVDHGQFDLLEETDFVSGCAFMAKASYLAEIGLFEEKLFAYFEDVDLMLRAKKLGYKLLYNGKTDIYHKVSRTAGIASPLTDYLITRNRLYVGYRYATPKVRYSLWKESLRFMTGGREAQRRGVFDFFLKKYENPNSQNLFQTKVASGLKPEPVKKTDSKYPLELSIVTVNYKTKELTLKLLESIFVKNSGFDKSRMEMIVLDNGSDDRIEADIREKFPEAKFIGLNENTGFAKGYNKGMGYTKGEYLLLLNSDIEVKGKSIRKILDFAKKKNGNAVVAGKLILPDASLQKSCYKLPTISGAVREYFFGKSGEYDLFAPRGNLSSKVEGAVMACFLIPRRVQNKVGYLSEESFLYFEDIEYCRRLKDAKIDLYYYPDAVFFHHHGASSEIIGKEKAYDYLKKGAKTYHGNLNYAILWLILRIGQKFRTFLKTL